MARAIGRRSGKLRAILRRGQGSLSRVAGRFAGSAAPPVAPALVFASSGDEHGAGNGLGSLHDPVHGITEIRANQVANTGHIAFGGSQWSGEPEIEVSHRGHRRRASWNAIESRYDFGPVDGDIYASYFEQQVGRDYSGTPLGVRAWPATPQVRQVWWQGFSLMGPCSWFQGGNGDPNAGTADDGAQNKGQHATWEAFSNRPGGIDIGGYGWGTGRDTGSSELIIDPVFQGGMPPLDGDFCIKFKGELATGDNIKPIWTGATDGVRLTIAEGVLGSELRIRRTGQSDLVHSIMALIPDGAIQGVLTFDSSAGGASQGRYIVEIDGLGEVLNVVDEGTVDARHRSAISSSSNAACLFWVERWNYLPTAQEIADFFAATYPANIDQSSHLVQMGGDSHMARPGKSVSPNAFRGVVVPYPGTPLALWHHGLEVGSMSFGGDDMTQFSLRSYLERWEGVPVGTKALWYGGVVEAGGQGKTFEQIRDEAEPIIQRMENLGWNVMFWARPHGGFVDGPEETELEEFYDYLEARGNPFFDARDVPGFPDPADRNQSHPDYNWERLHAHDPTPDTTHDDIVGQELAHSALAAWVLAQSHAVPNPASMDVPYPVISADFENSLTSQRGGVAFTDVGAASSSFVSGGPDGLDCLDLTGGNKGVRNASVAYSEAASNLICMSVWVKFSSLGDQFLVSWRDNSTGDRIGQIIISGGKLFGQVYNDLDASHHWACPVSDLSIGDWYLITSYIDPADNKVKGRIGRVGGQACKLYTRGTVFTGNLVATAQPLMLGGRPWSSVPDSDAHVRNFTVSKEMHPLANLHHWNGGLGRLDSALNSTWTAPPVELPTDNLTGRWEGDGNVYNNGTTQAADGQTVETWVDASGSGRDLVQLTTANKPIFRTNAHGGHAGLEFDDGDDILEVGAFLGTVYSIYAVVELDRDANSGDTSAMAIVAESDESATNEYYTLQANFGNDAINMQARTSAGTQNCFSTSGPVAGTLHLATGVQASANDRIARIDNTDEGSNSVSRNPSNRDKFSVGGLLWNGGSIASAVGGKILAVYTYSVAHDSAQMTQVHDYVSAKFSP